MLDRSRLPIALCALAVLASAPIAAGEDYVGYQECGECHEDLLEPYSHTIHARTLDADNGRTELMRRGCEACHGPAAAHVAEGGGRGAGDLVTFRAESPAAIERENAACLQCHGKGERLHWSGSAHQSRDVACTSCHTVMEKRSDRSQLAHSTVVGTCTSCHVVQRGQTYRNAHMPVREGAMDCTSCHNPHGTVAEALLRGDTVNDNCYSCHADKRGPFLWEHYPVTESCLNCHDPHGTPRERMLKLSPPRLCQQCHIPTLHPTEARRPEHKFVIGSSCVQCHRSVHGSNHPSGFGLTR